MTFASTTVSNTFLACIALTNLVIMTILYRIYKKNNFY
jgi:high-affinity nickel permease